MIQIIITVQQSGAGGGRVALSKRIQDATPGEWIEAQWVKDGIRKQQEQKLAQAGLARPVLNSYARN